MLLIQNSFVSLGYDVQSASTPNGVLYITGAPRYNHTGRVVIYRLNESNKVVVSQILHGEQVSLLNLVICCLWKHGLKVRVVCCMSPLTFNRIHV